MKRLCTLCARGGSKGVKGKNLRELAGKPLLAYSILQAQKSGLFDSIAVSSDSEQILSVAREYGVELAIVRPAEMATDTAGKLPAIRHCVLSAETTLDRRFDIIVDLDATSPLRLVSDIQGAVQLLESSDAPNVITGAPARRSPYFNLAEELSDGSVKLAKTLSNPILRRQDAPRCFDMNASIYAWKRQTLMDCEGVFQTGTRLFEMPEERSIDIDSELDFEWVKFIAIHRKRFQDVW